MHSWLRSRKNTKLPLSQGWTFPWIRWISEIDYKNHGDDKGVGHFPINRTFFPLGKISLEKNSWPHDKLVLTQSEDQDHALIMMMIMTLVMTNLVRDNQDNQEIDHDHNDFWSVWCSQVTAMMTNPDPASAVASAAIAAAAAGPLSKLVLGNQRQVLGNLRQVIGNQGQVQQSILVGITKTKTTRLDLFLLMPRLQVGGCPTGWTSSTTSSLLRTIYCYRFRSLVLFFYKFVIWFHWLRPQTSSLSEPWTRRLLSARQSSIVRGREASCWSLTPVGRCEILCLILAVIDLIYFDFWHQGGGARYNVYINICYRSFIFYIPWRCARYCLYYLLWIFYILYPVGRC